MKKFRVSFRPQAEGDLFGLYDYIARKADNAVAGAFIDRIEAACVGLEILPKHGVRRDDIRPGLRIMGFERRAAIVFEVLKQGSSHRSQLMADRITSVCCEAARTGNDALNAFLASATSRSAT